MTNITLPELKKTINFKTLDEEKMFENVYSLINQLDKKEGNIYFYTAYLLSKHFKSDINTIIASLIYRIVKKLNLDDFYLTCLFNEQILKMVKALDEFDDELINHSYNNKLMIIKSITKDVRVTIIKLVERLSVLQYLDDEQIEKSSEFIEETLSFYAQIAKLIGIYELKNVLENLCFRFNPNYNDAKKINNKIYEEYDMVIKKIKPLFSSIEVNMLNDIKFECNSMSNYDIFLKALEFEKRIKEMNNKEKIESAGFCSIKCLVDTREECYEVLYLLHQFKPIIGTFVDYLSGIKENEVRSIYTEVFVGKCLVDFRICTKDMNRVNSYGIVANWGSDLQQHLKNNYSFYSKLVDLENTLSDDMLVDEFRNQIIRKELYDTDSMGIRKEKTFKILYGDKN